MSKKNKKQKAKKEEQKLYPEIHVMLDIETMGVGVNAEVFQIAAAVFDPMDARLCVGLQDSKAVFNVFLKHDEGQNGGEIEGDTMKFWLKNVKTPEFEKALNNFFSKDDGYNAEHLYDFLMWLDTIASNTENLFIWSKGIDFDIPILKQTLDRYGLHFANLLQYRNFRDVRSYEAIYQQLTGKSSIKVVEPFVTKHNALDDVFNQINSIKIVHKHLFNTKEKPEEKIKPVEEKVKSAAEKEMPGCTCGCITGVLKMPKSLIKELLEDDE